MKKGELRRDSIIRTAEKLFFERGYDETSIQDILDALSISKGGFYHYFESKIALLEEICRQRAASELERIRGEMHSGKLNPTQKINLLLGALHLFKRESPDFTALVLKISYIDHDVHFREQTRSFMMESLRPLVDEAIAAGVADGSFFIRNPGQIGRIVLMLGCDVNDEACRMLAESPQNPDCVIGVVELLDAYREAVENLLGASFGTVFLFDVEHLMQGFRQTAVQLEILEAKS